MRTGLAFMSGGTDTISYADSVPAETDRSEWPQLVLAMESCRVAGEVRRLDLRRVCEVTIGRGAAEGAAICEARQRIQLEVGDRWLSGRHLRVARERGAWTVFDEGSKNGTFVNGRRVQQAKLQDGDVIEAGGTFLVFRPAATSAGTGRTAEVAGASAAIETMSPALACDFERLQRIASSGMPVLILGETGTGKEVVTRWLHGASGRHGDCVALNCGALPSALVEGELFGYRRGAFSGAREDRLGLVRAADGGTLMLDEIAELPLVSQAKLLRVLQEKEVLPLGATKPVSVDLRVVSATHQQLSDLVATDRFRHDLYARLAGFVIRLPPLRERKEDLGLLVMRLVQRIAGKRAQTLRLHRQVARTFFGYDWPMNIRQLEQVLRTAVALADDDVIRPEHLPDEIYTSTDRAADHAGAKLDRDEQALRDQLMHLLVLHEGNISALAREMGKDRVQIRRWCRRFGIVPQQFRHRRQ